MLPYEYFFYGGIFFLSGVLAASAGVAPLFVTIGTLFTSAVLFLAHFYGVHPRARLFAALILLVVAGSFYYRAHDVRFRAERIPFGQKLAFTGTVASDPVASNGEQQMKLSVTSPFRASILLIARGYPRLAYGDAVRGVGAVQSVGTTSYARYLEKELVRGTMRYPSIAPIGERRGSRVVAALYAIKHRIMAAFSNALPPDEAVFLSGLTIGARGAFPDELKDAMKRSGTTHLVALSGYNITILVAVVSCMLLSFLSRRAAFFVTVPIIIAFVTMTGAEASVVRAGVIGVLALLAREVGRAHDMRNVILAAGIVMVLANPKVLAFDIGFQLSFLALLGLVYVGPALMNLFHIEEGGKGPLSWKEGLITALAAQLATLPLLVGSFGVFSPVSLISNIAILEFIPPTMGLGFSVALASLVSGTVSLFLGLLAHVFLRLELWLIYFFARISFPLHFKMSVVLGAVYYLALGVFVWRYTKNHGGSALRTRHAK